VSTATDYENMCTGQGLNSDEVDKSNFPLPNLSKQLKKLTDDVYEGRGFIIIRGLDPDAYSLEDFTNFSRRLLTGHEPLDPRSGGIPNVNEA
jgi:hypothetical protein